MRAPFRGTLLALLATRVAAFSALPEAPEPSLLDEAEWRLVKKAAPWTRRAGLQVVEINEKFVLMGGRTARAPSTPVPIPGDSQVWSDVWESADDGVTWTQIAENGGSHWAPRAYFKCIVLGDRAYVMGGQNYKVVAAPGAGMQGGGGPPGDAAGPPPGIAGDAMVAASDFFNDVWSTNDGVAWRRETEHAGWTSRAGLSAITFDGALVVLGGSVNDDAAILAGPSARIYHNDVWRSQDGANWTQLAEHAPWAKRAGAALAVMGDALFLFGGECGFLADVDGVLPYFNDVWRTRDGARWERVTAEAPWPSRPGHWVLPLADRFVLFGGFRPDETGIGEDNPVDMWTSADGEKWSLLAARPWSATTSADVKYDFAAIVSSSSSDSSIYTFGGDRETFNFFDPVNYLRIDNDVWAFGPVRHAHGVEVGAAV